MCRAQAVGLTTTVSFDNGNYGLYITAVAQQVEDNELSGNSVSPGYRVPLANAAETAAFNLEEGLPLQQISVDAGTLTEDAIWRGGVSYWIQGNVTVAEWCHTQFVAGNGDQSRW